MQRLPASSASISPTFRLRVQIEKVVARDMGTCETRGITICRCARIKTLKVGPHWTSPTL
ncbi:hypothetical protein HETIRDRAFT_165522 [Heterobasidion irregulare TC 32-1]|uniref:Uncharacterized protein n=1 Tax=Heterobasidion irregulare (strain TC 32-1) TaxID=747525 RepID=W4JXP7_HETIT|nr:uncharacterized protein HETIRDRAFT_165522 [Heterobasidion irregulare TC 32-1]ETW78342.1 hypothetical protein HETIRDRAFT_165522 [Heterobasidion irregulare TC 32-1]